MRAAALGFLAAFALLAAACTPKPDDGLKGTVQEALLPSMDRDACEWGSSTFETEPSKWYGCWDYVRGEPAAVAPAALEVHE